MKNSYIKLNDNDNHLSLGNLFRTIKNNARIKNAALQIELFCIIFNVSNVNESTVNSYCTGYRCIGDDYKQIYIVLRKKYEKNSLELESIILNLLSIIDGSIYTDSNKLKTINQNKSMQKICNDLFNIAKNDNTVSSELKALLKEYFNNNDLYFFMCTVLFFVILEKKQPIYESDELRMTIEEIINKTYLSTNDITDFLKTCLLEGTLSVRGLKELAKKENAIACFQLGTLEFYGNIVGKPRYIIAYNYFETAAKKNHPAANWMLGHISSNNFQNMERNDELAWQYFKKAEELGSIAALNNIGLFYQEGRNPDKKKNLKKAKEYFSKAASLDYVYAYNNLGKIYETEQNYHEAYKQYLESANLGESWACNKVGEFNRLGLGCNQNIEKAFIYYNKGIENQGSEIEAWCYYNLAKYFYQNGSKVLNLEPDIEKALAYYKKSANKGNKEAQKELQNIVK